MDVLTVERLCEAHRDLPRRAATAAAAAAPPHITADDLEPAAWEGLWHAARTWQPDHGAPFRAWAWRRITGAIRDQQRADDPLPRRARTRVRHATEVRARLEQEHGRSVTDAECAAAAGWTRSEWAQTVADAAAGRAAASLDAAPWLTDTTPTPPTPERSGDVAGWAAAAAAALPRRHRIVYHHRVTGDTAVPDVAAILNVSHTRVSQLHRETVTAVADAVRWHLWGDPGADLGPIRAARRDRYREAARFAYQLNTADARRRSPDEATPPASPPPRPRQR